MPMKVMVLLTSMSYLGQNIRQDKSFHVPAERCYFIPIRTIGMVIVGCMARACNEFDQNTCDAYGWSGRDDGQGAAKGAEPDHPPTAAPIKWCKGNGTAVECDQEPPVPVGTLAGWCQLANYGDRYGSDLRCVGTAIPPGNCSSECVPDSYGRCSGSIVGCSCLSGWTMKQTTV